MAQPNDSPRAYGSMAVYVTKRADAAKLLESNYFDVDGKSPFTRVFEPRRGPRECVKCLRIGQGLFVYESAVVWKVCSARTPSQ